MRMLSFILTASLTAGLALAEAGPETLQGVPEPLLGVWQQVDVEAPTVPETLEITATHCAVAAGGKVGRVDPLIGVAGDELVRSIQGERTRYRFAVEGDLLTLSTTHRRSGETITRRYRRLAERPEVFDLEPLPLGDARERPGAKRLAAIRAELAARRARDQEVREAFKTAKNRNEVLARMQQVDRDNAAYLVRLIAEVGWIDVARFGEEAASAAFLIVQHGGDLRLRLTVLPELRREAEKLGAAQDYALLFDRTRLQLGRKQRYGTQVFFTSDGNAVMPALEEPKSVDLRRLEIGLPPLGEYLDLIRGAYGEQREITIREDF